MTIERYMIGDECHITSRSQAKRRSTFRFPARRQSEMVVSAANPPMIFEWIDAT
jgi:hypothetical protein